MGPSGTRIATASLKGTVIRVFSCHDGSKLYELRRGLKRTASIYSLSFSACGSFLGCSSNTETVHVFKLEDSPRDMLAGSPPSDSEGWFGYINTMVSASAGYLPTQMTDALLQGRAFASVHLNQTAAKNICTLTMIKRSLRLVVCNTEGQLQLYGLDQEEGGYCSLIRQFLLAGTPSGVTLEPLPQEEEEMPAAIPGEACHPTPPDSPILEDEERFHEMSSSQGPAPNTCFLLDEEGDFLPTAFGAS